MARDKVTKREGSSKGASSSAVLERIAAGELNLIGIRRRAGVFCDLSEGFRRHQEDPSQFPMFRDLVKAAGCSSKGEIFSARDELNTFLTHRTHLNARLPGSSRNYEVDLNEAVLASRAWDAGRGIKASDPKGFVFHESR